MNMLTIYLVKSFLCSALLGSVYYFVLRNRTCHHYNRFYLLATIVISVTLPLITIRVAHAPLLNSNWFPDKFENSGTFSNSAQYFVLLAYLLVTMALVARLAIQVLTVYQLKKKGRQVPMQGFALIETSSEMAPFTFLNNVFWKLGTPIDDANGKQILLHELAHVRGYHTIDKFFIQFTAAIFWINPLFGFFHRELNVVHEFIADKNCIAEGDTESFAKMLLCSLLHSPIGFQISQGFFQSPIQRRLKMIASKRQHRAPAWRKLTLFPALLLLISVVSTSSTNLDKNQAQKRNDEQASLHKRIDFKLNRRPQ